MSNSNGSLPSDDLLCSRAGHHRGSVPNTKKMHLAHCHPAGTMKFLFKLSDTKIFLVSFILKSDDSYSLLAHVVHSVHCDKSTVIICQMLSRQTCVFFSVGIFENNEIKWLLLVRMTV